MARARLPSVLALALFATLAGATAIACDEQAELLDKAKQQHADGDLDGALVTLERVRDGKAGSEASTNARTLGTEWLIAAADAEASPHGARVRLVQALEWSPDSGAAQARLCRLFVKMEQHAAGQQCLDDGLKGKTGVPQDIVAEVRAALAEHDDASTRAERKRLLESPSAHHWKALVERYPQSEEAQVAETKLRRHASLCADLAAFVDPLKKEIERQKRVATKYSERPDGSRNERIVIYEGLGKEAMKHSRMLKNLAGDVDAHQLAEGEKPAQKPLRTALWAVSDSAAALGEDMERNALENLDSYENQAFAALSRWTGAVSKLAASVDDHLGAVQEVCSGDGGADANDDAADD